MAEYPFYENEEVSLCEAIDRILNKGVVIMGEVTISVANVDLIYLALHAVLSSIETIRDTPQREIPIMHMALGAKVTNK